MKFLYLHSNTPTLTSNWVSRLFWFGLAEGKIQKNAEQIFLKEAKTAAFQLSRRMVGTGCGGKSSVSVKGSFYNAVGKRVKIYM